MQIKLKSLPLFCLLLAFSSAYSAPRSFNPPKDDPPVYSKNPEANALYIQGLDYLSKGKPWAGGTVENAKTALKLFRQAAQKDPKFALAYVGQAEALDGTSFSVSGSTSPVKVFREQEADAIKAIKLDDSLPQAHQMLAEIYCDNEYDWPNAEKELKRLIELSPNSSAAHTRYGLFLGTVGRFEEAEAQLNLAKTMAPNSPAPYQTMMQVLYWQHKDDAAVEQGLKAVSLDKGLSSHFFLGFVYIHQGQLQKGIEEMKLAATGGDAGSLAALAYAYAMAGDKVEMQKALDRFNQHPAHDHVYYGLAQVYVALGDKDRAINLIEKDYARRSSRLKRAKFDATLDPLRQDPRFKQLMHKMHFDQ